MGSVSPQTLADWRETIAALAMQGQPIDLGSLVEQFVTSLYNRRVADLTKYGFIHRGLRAWHGALLEEIQRAEAFLTSAARDTQFTGVQLSMLTAQEIAAKPKPKAGRGGGPEASDVRREKMLQPMVRDEDVRAYVTGLVNKLRQVEADLSNVEKYIAEASAWQQQRAADLQNVSRELYDAAQGVLAVFRGL